MKHTISVFCICLLCTISAGAQDIRAALLEDPSRASGLHHFYEMPEYHDTKAPRGYKPFYVSHYGRHGSRYQTSERYYDRTLPLFDTLRMMGILTEKGEAIAKDLEVLSDAHKGIAGYLTDRGAAEHQAIAQRLYRRVPQLFRNPDRKEVFCASTPIQRCIQSMANFCVSLTRSQQDLQITMHSGERYKDYLLKDFPRSEYNKYRAVNVSADIMDDRAFFCSIVTDTTAAFEWLSDRRGSFMYNVLNAGSIANCLDSEMPDLYRYFSQDEIYSFFLVSNSRSYASMADIISEGGARARYVAEPILADILERADAAISEDSHRCADLRFGHDSGLGPLLSLLQVEGYNVTCLPTDYSEQWVGYRMLPMGSNVQFIFYRNKSSQVLVKIVRNDAETIIPALEPYQGPYYRWEDLRAYFVSLLNR